MDGREKPKRIQRAKTFLNREHGRKREKVHSRKRMERNTIKIGELTTFIQHPRTLILIIMQTCIFDASHLIKNSTGYNLTHNEGCKSDKKKETSYARVHQVLSYSIHVNGVILSKPEGWSVALFCVIFLRVSFCTAVWNATLQTSLFWET